jgi:hypothetical protein
MNCDSISTSNKWSGQQWMDAGLFVQAGEVTRAFLSGDADMVLVPEGLCQVLRLADPVDASISQDATNRNNVIISQGTIRTLLPKSLLMHIRAAGKGICGHSIDGPLGSKSHLDSHPS